MEIKINVGIRESVLMDAVHQPRPQRQQHPEKSNSNNKYEKKKKTETHLMILMKNTTPVVTLAAASLLISSGAIKCVQLLNCINMKCVCVLVIRNKENMRGKTIQRKNEKNHDEILWAPQPQALRDLGTFKRNAYT